MAIRAMTPIGRLAFPNLFVPAKPNPEAEAVYSCALLFDDDADLTDLRGAVKAAAEDKWGEKAIKVLKTTKGNPFHPQADKDLDGYGETGIYINVKSKNQPGVVNAKVQPVLDADEVFAGMQVRATVSVYAWEHPVGGRGVSFGLQNLQVVKDDGTRYDGRKAATADFDAVESAGEDEREAVTDEVW